MKTVGQLVQDSMDLSDRGLLDLAFIPACDALNLTAQKSFEEGTLIQNDHQAFIREHWRLISFAGIPRDFSLPADLPFRLRRAVPSFHVPSIIEELVIFTVRQSIGTRRVPVEVAFNNMGILEVKNDKLIYPKSLIFGILAPVVFHPVNKNEIIPDRYWLNVWDFKMFVSELWGRMDLAERIMAVYL